MQIYEYQKGKKLNIGKTVVALGFFDGVHIGHRELLRRAKAISEERGLGFAVFTFKAEESGFKGSGRLYSTEDKLSIFEAIGVETVIITDFPDVCNISAESFVEDSLISDIGCTVAVAGYDFRFGKGAFGDVGMLCEIMSRCGGSSVVVEEQTFKGKKISTTVIKELFAKGEIFEANALLGEPYFIRGRVSRGNGFGKVLGFPTINIPISKDAFSPRHGVYRAEVKIGGKVYTGVTNIGICPTFEEREIHAETFLLDFSEDVYGGDVKVSLLDFLRDEKRFDSAEQLKMQINVDVNRVKNGN